MEWPWLFPRQGSGENPLRPGIGGEEDTTDPTTTSSSSSTTAQPTDSTNPASPGQGDGTQDTTDGSDGDGGSERGGSNDEDWVVKFNETNFANGRVYGSGNDRGGMIRFGWEPSNITVIIEDVTWRGRQGDDEKYVSIAQSSFNEARQGSNDRPLVNVDEYGASLVYKDFFDESDLSDYRANRMTISVRWLVEGSGKRGLSTSGIFTVGSESEDAQKLDEFEDLVDTSDDPKVLIGSENIDSTKPNIAGGSSTTREPSAGTGTGSTNAANTSDSDDGDGGGGGGGGLSTGAIAGIGVAGGVVFLALIGALVFFLLRRRRRGKDRGQYNNPTNSSTFMAGDKEVHQVTESPHSTYSNDQQVPLSNLPAAGPSTTRDAGGHHHHHQHLRHDDDDDGDYTPYRDDDAGAGASAVAGARAASPDSPASVRAGRSDGAGTPHGVSRSVAHLVEEGMTEDEIRRLEEEERQLDDAIQRHGRGR